MSLQAHIMGTARPSHTVCSHLRVVAVEADRSWLPPWHLITLLRSGSAKHGTEGKRSLRSSACCLQADFDVLGRRLQDKAGTASGVGVSINTLRTAKAN